MLRIWTQRFGVRAVSIRQDPIAGDMTIFGTVMIASEGHGAAPSRGGSEMSHERSQSHLEHSLPLRGLALPPQSDSVRKCVDGLIPANLSARIPALLAGADMACTILPIVVAQPYFDAVYYFQASTREF